MENESAVGEWMVHTIVRPSCANSFSRATTSFAVVESRPDVGSSRKITRGLVSI